MRRHSLQPRRPPPNAYQRGPYGSSDKYHHRNSYEASLAGRLVVPRSFSATAAPDLTVASSDSSDTGDRLYLLQKNTSNHHQQQQSSKQTMQPPHHPFRKNNNRRLVPPPVVQVQRRISPASATKIGSTANGSSHPKNHGVAKRRSPPKKRPIILSPENAAFNNEEQHSPSLQKKLSNNNNTSSTTTTSAPSTSNTAAAMGEKSSSKSAPVSMDSAVVPRKKRFQATAVVEKQPTTTTLANETSLSKTTNTHQEVWGGPAEAIKRRKALLSIEELIEQQRQTFPESSAVVASSLQNNNNNNDTNNDDTINNNSSPPPKKKKTKKDCTDTSLVQMGTRVAVYWDGEDAYFRGTVTGIRSNHRKFFVQYDDGDEEWIKLAKHRFRLVVPKKRKRSIESQPVVDVSTDSSPAVTSKEKDPVVEASNHNNSNKRIKTDVDDAFAMDGLGIAEAVKIKQAIRNSLEQVSTSPVLKTKTETEKSHAGETTGSKYTSKKKKKTNHGSAKKKMEKEKGKKTGDPIYNDSVKGEKSALSVAASSAAADGAGKKISKREKSSGDNFNKNTSKRDTAEATDKVVASQKTAVRKETPKRSTSIEQSVERKTAQLPSSTGESPQKQMTMPVKRSRRDPVALQEVPLADLSIAEAIKIKQAIRNSLEEMPSKENSSVVSATKQSSVKLTLSKEERVKATKRAKRARAPGCDKRSRGQGDVDEPGTKMTKRAKQEKEVGDVSDWLSSFDRNAGSSSDDSETDEEELMNWASKMFGVQQPPPISRPKVSSHIRCAPEEKKAYGRSDSTASQSTAEKEEEANRKKESARPLTAEEIKAILEDDFAVDCPNNWVRRSVRQPSKNALNSPLVKDLIERLKSNDQDMVVLKMKKYVNDPNAPSIVIDTVLDALEENTNCEALYIQNFNEGMRDDQVKHLAKVLQRPECKIWCLNLGETYNVKRRTWRRFISGLKKTKITHIYVSEHIISTEQKDQIRDTIRRNRKKHNMHNDPENLDTIVKCTHCWWNPINAKVLRPYLKKRGYEKFLQDKDFQGLRGSTSGATLT